MNKIYVRLAKTNMRNNRQLYVPYILSGLITVAMFYLMTFLSGNEGLAHARGAEMIGRILSFGVGIIGIFSYIFIFYTNSFISKRRKKESMAGSSSVSSETGGSLCCPGSWDL